MVRSLTSIKVEVKISSTLTNLLTDASSTSVNHPSLNYKPTLVNGIGDNQANRDWQSLTRSLNAGQSEVLDLYDMAATDIGAGLGRDGVGQPIVFEDVVAIAIVNNNAVTAVGQLEVDPDAFNGWTPVGTHTVASGGALRGESMLMKSAPGENGFDITDGSNHRLRFTANGGAVSYSIYLLCRSDDEFSSSVSSSSPSSSSHSSTSASTSTSKSSSSSSQSNSTSSSESSSSQSSSSSPSSSESSSSQSSSSISESSSSSQSTSSSSFSRSESSSESSSSSVSSSSQSSVSSSLSSSVSSSSASSSSWSS